MDENKFTPTAEEALQLAQEAAGELGHGYMGTEHLLLGLMREDEGLAHTVLTEAGLTDDLLTEMIRKTAGSRPADNSGSAQNLSPRMKHVLEIAMEDAIRGGYAYIGTPYHGRIVDAIADEGQLGSLHLGCHEIFDLLDLAIRHEPAVDLVDAKL